MVRIAGCGHAVPPVVVPSGAIDRRLGREPGWVERRTGIRTRRLAGPDQAASDLAAEAVRAAVAGAGPLPRGLLLLATSTPDHPLPPTAPRVAARCDLAGWGAADLAAACGGFVYALALGHAHCLARRCPVVVAAANVLSRRTDPHDPATAGLFADGAGAVLLLPADGPDCLLSVHLGSDGDGYERVMVPAGGSRRPHTADTLAAGEGFIRMARGPELFRAAVEAMAAAGRAALADGRMTVADIDWWVPHPANARLIRETGRRLGVPDAKTISVVEEWGNSSAAGVPLALSLAAADGRLRRGQTLLLTAAGAGMVDAAAVVRW